MLELEAISHYKAAAAARAAAQAGPFDPAGMTALLANERAQLARLLASMTPGVSYKWDDATAAVRKGGPLGARLTLAPVSASSVTPVTPAITPAKASGFASWLFQTATTVVVVLALARPDLLADAWRIVKDPFSRPPAYSAAVVMDRKIAAVMASSFSQAAVDIRAGKTLADAKAANQARTKAVAAWQAGDPIIAILDGILPGKDDAAATAAQKQAYAAALDEFAAGWKSRAN